MLSTALCNLYIGDLERRVIVPELLESEPATPSFSVLARHTDDFLLLTESRAVADAFSRRVRDGFPEYNLFSNSEKVQHVAFDPAESMTLDASLSSSTSSPRTEGSWLSWCGLSIHIPSLQVVSDRARLFDATLLLDHMRAPGDLLSSPAKATVAMLRASLRHQCQPLFIDSSLHALTTVARNVIEGSLLVACKVVAIALQPPSCLRRQFSAAVLTWLAQRFTALTERYIGRQVGFREALRAHEGGGQTTEEASSRRVDCAEGATLAPQLVTGNRRIQWVRNPVSGHVEVGRDEGLVRLLEALDASSTPTTDDADEPHTLTSSFSSSSSCVLRRLTASERYDGMAARILLGSRAQRVEVPTVCDLRRGEVRWLVLACFEAVFAQLEWSAARRAARLLRMYLTAAFRLEREDAEPHPPRGVPRLFSVARSHRTRACPVRPVVARVASRFLDHDAEDPFLRQLLRHIPVRSDSDG